MPDLGEQFVHRNRTASAPGCSNAEIIECSRRTDWGWGFEARNARASQNAEISFPVARLQQATGRPLSAQGRRGLRGGDRIGGSPRGPEEGDRAPSSQGPGIEPVAPA